MKKDIFYGRKGNGFAILCGWGIILEFSPALELLALIRHTLQLSYEVLHDLLLERAEKL